MQQIYLPYAHNLTFHDFFLTIKSNGKKNKLVYHSLQSLQGGPKAIFSTHVKHA